MAVCLVTGLSAAVSQLLLSGFLHLAALTPVSFMYWGVVQLQNGVMGGTSPY
jgi:hypothetical protein